MTTAQDVNVGQFLTSLPNWLKDHEGQYVLMHDGERFGFYPTEEAAFEAGYQKFKLQPFFVQIVRPADQLAASPRFVSL